MSKVKRILSVIMAMVMVLAMSVPTFAATNSAKITVHNAGTDAHFKAVRIVEPDTTTVTGWKFVGTYEQYFTQAFKMDAQTIIKGMIYAQNTSDSKGQAIDGFDGMYANALELVYNAVTVTTDDGGSPITVTDGAGVYFVKGQEEGYMYNPMAAYISFGSYNTSTGEPTALENTTIEAKREKIVIDKTAEDQDRVTLLGREETFHVKSEVPFLPLTDSNRYFYVKDILTGGTYVTVADGDNAGKVDLTVKYGNGSEKHYYVDVKEENGKQSFTVNLSDLLENNANANTDLDISYKVTVTDLQVHNEVIGSKADNASTNDFGSKSEDLFTGQLTMTKYAEDGKTALKGAGFKITRKGTYTVLRFTQEGNGVYRYDKNGKEEVFTGDDGTVIVKGLDCGKYVFTETTAPTGYSLNTDTREVEIKLAKGKTTAEVQGDVVNDATSITDTKLSALPSTGGIGTTIFTIGGCAIMIVAAGLFFATRRKTQK